jgi:hypothetical protein
MRIMGATAQTSRKRRLARTLGMWAAAAATAALVLIGLGIEVSADVVKQPDQGLSFEGTCKAGGGIYTETIEGDGNAWCQFEDDSQVVCSLEGTDCYYIPSQSRPTGSRAIRDTQHVAPVDIQEDGAVQSGASAAPTEHISVQAEEPVAAEANDLQP